MDLVTFTAIMTLSTGQPYIWRMQVAAETCEEGSARIRRERKDVVAWCPAEIRPLRISDELQKSGSAEYVPDAMDALGMPPRRR